MVPRSRAALHVVHAHLVVADPGEHAPEVAMSLRHGQHGVDHLPVDQAEVAGVDGDVDLAHRAEQPVEPPRGGQLRAALALARLTDPVDHLVAGSPLLGHLRHDLGGVLEVGVHDDHRLTPRVLEAGGDGDLVPEVPRQPHDAEPRVGSWICRIAANEPSVDPSSTRTTSAGPSSWSITAASRWWSSGRISSSSRTGITKEYSTATAEATLVPAAQASRMARRPRQAKSAISRATSSAGFAALPRPSRGGWRPRPARRARGRSGAAARR